MNKVEYSFLYLNQETFLWTNNEKGCVYNCLNQKIFVFKNNEVLNMVLEELLNVNNLYRTRLSQKLILDKNIQNWITDIENIEAGGVESEEDAKKRITFKPLLKIQQTQDFYRYNYEQRKESGNIMDNLHTLIFNINGSKYGNDNYFKQILYPKQSTEVLNKDDVFDFIDNSKKSNLLSTVGLLGNIWEYPDYEKLISNLKNYPYRVVYYCLEEDCRSNTNIDFLDENFNLNILVTECASKKISPIISPHILYTFIVASEQDMEQIEDIVSLYPALSYKVIPIYTGKNIDFMREYVFIREEDFLNANLSKREIFTRQAINIHDFGTLTIDCDGAVYSNTHSSPIGRIDESPHSIVYREITEGKCWLRIRDQYPCSNCIYQWLCPSPSNYELAIERPNLCDLSV
ncbi:TIGR04150 pseudo-rSAM protein [Bacteroides sp. 519]|uniref:TIGR04150 pseudo-rSAM protein n=1 Tax=Bacteroides sp. 519 TaxID=2302937 RepID=UPI0013D004C7|nr:TIGR04150 pseudo-rSAM protein [Bacteroides sp. 519]NDV60769.1 TIGR04150 pseudo-rSAM protein [Bacteroides sp. 519]